MKFVKMHGCGNDYIYVDGAKEQVENKPDVVRRLSDRHFGIGGDGVIFINPSAKADFEMEMYNADGSRSEMCGNGIRCVAKFVYDLGLTDKNPVRIESGGKVKTLYLHLKDGKVDTVTVYMGEPVLTPAEVPVNVRAFASEIPDGTADPVVDQPIRLTFPDGTVTESRMTCVSMGNPHAVTYVDSVDAVDMERVGLTYEHHPAYPKYVNTEFIEVVEKKHIRMRVWERGTGETLACGTGACASVVAGVLNGKNDRRTTVHLLGGDLEIEWREDNNCVYMTGPARIVFEGEVDPDAVEADPRA
ncbi:MAG: diaminopimelate epimerase [Lachnospiraceae bacterium]|nr:diaminopimelate epimerase [Lachnospiraceae bacterium]